MAWDTWRRLTARLYIVPALRPVPVCPALPWDMLSPACPRFCSTCPPTLPAILGTYQRTNQEILSTGQSLFIFLCIYPSLGQDSSKHVSLRIQIFARWAQGSSRRSAGSTEDPAVGRPQPILEWVRSHGGQLATGCRRPVTETARPSYQTLYATSPPKAL